MKIKRFFKKNNSVSVSIISYVVFFLHDIKDLKMDWIIENWNYAIMSVLIGFMVWMIRKSISSEINNANDRIDLLAKYLYFKNKNDQEVDFNRYSFYDNQFKELVDNINKSFENLNIELTDLNINTGEHIIKTNFSKIKVEYRKDLRIKNPNDNDLFKRLENDFLEEFKITNK